MKKGLKEYINEDVVLDIVEEFEAETENVLRDVRNCVRRGGFKISSKDLAVYLRSIASNIERTANEIENFPKTDLDESENNEIVELKIGDIVNIKKYGKYDDEAKVTEIGKIKGGYFNGRPYVEAYESWGKGHAAFSTSGQNFCFMRSSSGKWIVLKNDTLLDPKYWPYLDNLFGYNKITEAKNSEEDFQNWSKDKRKRYLDYLQKSVKSIMMGGESRHSADYNKPMTVKKTGSDTAFAYIVRYTNKQGVGMAYEFRGDGTKSEGLYGCFPNSQVQRLYKEFQEKEAPEKSKKFIKEAAMKEDNSRFDEDFYNFLSETFDSYDGSYNSLVQDVRSIENDWVEGEENRGTIRSTGETWLRQKGRELCADELLDE